MSSPKIIQNQAAIEAAVTRVAHEIYERNASVLDCCGLIGLPTRGIPLAKRLAAQLKPLAEVEIPVGHIDISFHRDDLDLRVPVPGDTDVPFELTGRTLILVDDVLFSGRTVRAALDALLEFGRPEAVQFFTLVDRGHHRLPIAADYIGFDMETSYDDDVLVKLADVDNVEQIEVVSP